MSRKLPSLGPEQGSVIQFQLQVSQPDRRSRRQPRDRHFEALGERLPNSEDEWQKARRRLRFTTPADINAWVSDLVSLDRALPQNLRKLINLAIFCVESRKDEDTAHRNYEARASQQCLVRTIRNYASLVRGVIALMDQIYLKLRHRAFEAVLLYSPLDYASLVSYKREPDRFKSYFRDVKILPEEHASQALYLPFLVAYGHPQYKYNEICRALGTNTLKEPEFLRFVSVRENGKPVPHILNAPPKNRYDAIRNRWTRDSLTEHFNTEEIYAIPNRMDGYKRFDLPDIIQQKSAMAAKEQDGCVPQDIPGVISFKFDWTVCHDDVGRLVLGLLVELGFISQGQIHLSRNSVRHDTGPITVRSNWLKIIIPTAPTAEPAVMSLSSKSFREDVTWNMKSGFLLGPGITHSPSGTLHYISMSIPTLKS
ncbi:hypothetical protein Forpe1208_v016748 [Fusarium oxysporum f. sp. rapae]|uniref:Uncharacterized protein n=2 Tax=Fusarium oxysporum TaxID=5507 RepID=A0A8J5NDP3_FUSOX|nr:hypothetical protein Forpe1208_v016748 [Fusarium oxysporum f. sp. rapae]